MPPEAIPPRDILFLNFDKLPLYLFWKTGVFSVI